MLIQMMVCYQFWTKQSPKPKLWMLTHCQLNPKEQSSAKTEITIIFIASKMAIILLRPRWVTICDVTAKLVWEASSVMSLWYWSQKQRVCVCINHIHWHGSIHVKHHVINTKLGYGVNMLLSYRFHVTMTSSSCHVFAGMTHKFHNLVPSPNNGSQDRNTHSSKWSDLDQREDTSMNAQILSKINGSMQKHITPVH